MPHTCQDGCYWNKQNQTKHNTISVGECGEIGTLAYGWWEFKVVQSSWETVWRFLKKIKIELPFDIATHSGYLSQRMIIIKELWFISLECPEKASRWCWSRESGWYPVWEVHTYLLITYPKPGTSQVTTVAVLDEVIWKTSPLSSVSLGAFRQEIVVHSLVAP